MKNDFDQISKEISIEDPVKMYLKDIGKFALLSNEEEVELDVALIDELYNNKFGGKAKTADDEEFDDELEEDEFDEDEYGDEPL